MAKSKLDLALDSLQKKFGEDSISLFGKQSTKIERVPLSSVNITSLIGGGYPRGRMIEIFGDESSGKCMSEDSYVLTNKGYQTVKEIFSEHGLNMATCNKEVEKKAKLMNLNGRLENTTHFTYNGKRKLKRIKTKTGYELKRTYNHPLLVLSPRGNLIWKKASQLEIGDYLVGTKLENIARDKQFGDKEVNKDTCYAIGLLIADGYFGKTIRLTNNDPAIIEFVETKMSKALEISGVSEVKDNRNESKNYNLKLNKGSSRDKHYIDFYTKYSLKQGVAKDKNMPKWVRQLNAKSMKEVICGYFDAECHINKRGIEVTSASKELIYQVKLMLSQFGITSIIHIKKVKAYPDNSYYRLSISGEDVFRYYEIIGTRSKVREEQFKIALKGYDETKNNTNYKVIPHIQEDLVDLYNQQDSDLKNRETRKLLNGFIDKRIEATYTRVKKILDIASPNYITKKLEILLNLTFERIIEIEDLEPEPTYDFAMKETHTFIADGIINHNTTLATYLSAQCQDHYFKDKERNGVVAYIDVEHAFDPEYAKTFGLDMDKVLYSQPQTAEQALDIVEALVDSDAVDLIVVDSVASLVPQAEADADMASQQMGLQARLLSKACRKLTAKLKPTSCSILFLNQQREVIGAYRPTKTTSGGKALQFYSSIRIEVKRRENLEENKKVIGMISRLAVKKNKVGVPFKQCEMEIIFGKGYSIDKEYYSAFVKYGLISLGGGGWYKLTIDGEEKKFQGLTKLETFFNENPELFKEYKEKVQAEIKKQASQEDIPLEPKVR